VPSKFEAQRLADEFMVRVNEWNNDPATFPSSDETLSTLLVKCSLISLNQEKTLKGGTLNGCPFGGATTEILLFSAAKLLE